MTTLIDELEQAADDADILARMVATMGHAAEVIGVTARARSLRQRAAWVRELEAELRHSVDVGNAFAGICLVQIQRLTGPIPSETAPAIAAAIDKTFEQDAGLLRRLADSPRPTPVQEAARMWREGDAGAKPELLPCPFCGGVAAPPTHMPLGSFQAAECTKCGARGGFAQSLPNSYATWNRRTAPPAEPRCEVTGHLCGTDTTLPGGCQCATCRASAAPLAVPGEPPAWSWCAHCGTTKGTASWAQRYRGSWSDATDAGFWCTQPLHYDKRVGAVKLFSPAFAWGQPGACLECWEAGRRSTEDPAPADPTGAEPGTGKR